MFVVFNFRIILLFTKAAFAKFLFELAIKLFVFTVQSTSTIKVELVHEFFILKLGQNLKKNH